MSVQFNHPGPNLSKHLSLSKFPSGASPGFESVSLTGENGALPNLLTLEYYILSACQGELSDVLGDPKETPLCKGRSCARKAASLAVDVSSACNGCFMQPWLAGRGTPLNNLIAKGKGSHKRWPLKLLPPRE
jgi:hypothetical protein